MADLRIGVISCIDYNRGMAKVTFKDKNNTVTPFLPILNNNEYNMPQLGTSVVVAYVDATSAIILGSYWNKNNIPPNGSKGIYEKKFDNAYIKYDASSKTMTIKSDIIKLDGEVIE